MSLFLRVLAIVAVLYLVLAGGTAGPAADRGYALAHFDVQDSVYILRRLASSLPTARYHEVDGLHNDWRVWAAVDLSR